MNISIVILSMALFVSICAIAMLIASKSRQDKILNNFFNLHEKLLKINFELNEET